MKTIYFELRAKTNETGYLNTLKVNNVSVLRVDTDHITLVMWVMLSNLTVN